MITTDNKTIRLELGENIALELARCEAGEFLMGSPRKELGRDPEEKQKLVKIPMPFWLGVYPVTEAQFQSLMQNDSKDGKNSASDLPCNFTSCVDAENFCYMMNQKFADQLPAGYHFALPTSEQWEYACRAGTKTSLNSGMQIGSRDNYCRNLDKLGWYAGNSNRQVHPVGQKLPNTWGLYDMHGNVWEWCDTIAESNTADTQEEHECRILRGGAADCSPSLCRAAVFTQYSGGTYRRDDAGFRLAIVPGTLPLPIGSISSGLPTPEGQRIAWIKSGFGMELIHCSAGNFVKDGAFSPQTEDFKPIRIEIEEDFYLGKYPVTQRQYEAIMGTNPSECLGANRPVEQIRKKDALEFCRRLTDLGHQNGWLPKDCICNLPTENHWEYACRAGTETKFYNGVTEAEVDEADAVVYNPNNGVPENYKVYAIGWFDKNSGQKTHDVGLKAPNAWGFYDMAGNVNEWCLDEFSEQQGSKMKQYGVIRGGDYFGCAEDLASSARTVFSLKEDGEDAVPYFTGFRIAVTNWK